MSNETEPKQNASFASVVKNKNQKEQIEMELPTYEQGIYIESIDGLTISDYIYAIGKVIGPKNILFSARINNRIQMFLAKIEDVNTVIGMKDNIEIKNNKVEIRRMKSLTQRIIISNVSPVVPHHIIENALKDANLKTASSVRFLRVGCDDPEYKHVLSFRRQIYITPEENNPLPTTLLIEHSRIKYRIFLTTDMTCFSCKQEGHVASNCLKNQPINQSQPLTTKKSIKTTYREEPKKNDTDNSDKIIDLSDINEQNDNTENNNHTDQSNTNEQNNTTDQNNTSEQNNTTNENKTTEQNTTNNKLENGKKAQLETSNAQKRKLSSSTEEISTSDKKEIEETGVENIAGSSGDNMETTNSKKTTLKNKKPKQIRSRSVSPKGTETISIAELMDMEDNLKTEMKKYPEKYSITYENLKDFLENAKDATNVVETAKEYTNNVEELIETLKNIYTKLRKPQSKNRITRLMTKLQTELNKDSTKK